MMMFRPNSPATTDLFESIRADVFEEMEDFGKDVATDLKERISVPVGYRIGPKGGTYIIRSAPGEPPRKETGTLLNSVESEVETDADVVTLEISSDAPYAGFLEDGTERMAPRPVWEDVADEYTDPFFDRVVAAVSGK
jgi:bacteriophage HK97-gp10 putative tail-component